MKKVCILILGKAGDGKSTIIRALTGCGKAKIWKIKSLSGKTKNAFVVLMSPQETAGNHTPEVFPDSLEREYGVKRDDYEMMICPIQTRIRRVQQHHEHYMDFAKRKFDIVKVALIEKNHEGIENKQTDELRNFCNQTSIKFITIDCSNDPHLEASKIRNAFYLR